MINLAQPDLSGNEQAYVTQAIGDGWISSLGKFIPLFENEISKLAGTKYAVATNNGTTALHLALVALGIGPGDEVIIPTVTYIATANAVTYCGAKPIFADSIPTTLNISTEHVEKLISPKTKAIIAVHLYGIPADVNKLREICDKHNIFLIEDAAESHGSEIFGKRAGSFGHLSTFSFFGNKIVTTGEGGAVVTDDEELKNKLTLLRGQGMDPTRRYWFPVVGFNYRMTNIQAAIGLAQMERFDKIIEKRQLIADYYESKLKEIDEISYPIAPSGYKSVPWLQNVFLNEGNIESRDRVIKYLYDHGVDSRPVFYPMHQLPPYQSNEVFPIADEWTSRGMSLPLHTALTFQEVDQVTRTLQRALANL